MSSKYRVSVDAIIQQHEEVLLIQRKHDPYKHDWALPGGHIEPNESAEEAVKREVKEETNLAISDSKQFKTYSDPDRDPRGRTITIVFYVKNVHGDIQPATDAENAKFFPLNDLPHLAFDHEQIIQDFKNR